MPAATTTKKTATKSKAKPKAETQAPKAVTKLDGMADLTEVIEIWNGMSTHPNEFFAKMNVLQVKAVVLGEYAIYDFAKDTDNEHRPAKHESWFEVYKLITVQNRKIWNRVVSAIRSYSQADDIVQELRRGESAIKIQQQVDADYQCKPMAANGSFDRAGVRGSIPPMARCGSDLYGDRHEWRLKPEIAEVLESPETGEW